MQWLIHKPTLLNLLVAILVALIIINIWLLTIPSTDSLARLIFDFDAEWNIPTMFSALLLLICSGLLFYIGFYRYLTTSHSIHRSFIIEWFVLGLVFFFLFLDDLFSFHERLNNSITIESFPNTWILWGIGFVALVFVMTLRLIRSFERVFRNKLLIAASIFLVGAVIVEGVSGIVRERAAGQINAISYRIVALIEESFEVTGLIVFIYALLWYWNKLKKRDNRPGS